MCDPVTIGNMALTAAGTIYNNDTQERAARASQRAQQDALAAANKLRDAERNRQDAFATKSRARFEQNLTNKTLETQEAQIANERRRAEQLYSENIPDATTNNSLLSGMQNAGENFDTAAAKTPADTSADVRRRVNALARLESYGGNQQLNDFARVSTNRDQGTISNNAGNSLSTNTQARNAALNHAAQVRSGSTLLGDVMVGAGQAGMFAGAAGWTPFGSGAGWNPFSSAASSVGTPGASTLSPQYRTIAFT